MDDTSLKKKPAEDASKAPSAEILAPPTGISFSTRLDHTAVWVGDQFHYMVFVDYTPEYDFVLDNTTRETVNMDPFQVMDLSKKVTTLNNKNKRLVVDITLASFQTAKTAQEVPRVTLYYFRKDQKSAGADQQAAESLVIPGPVVGLRSTLPPDPRDIRDAITVLTWDKARWTIPTLGTIAMILLIILIGFEAVMYIRRQNARKGPDRRKAMDAVRARWTSRVPSDFSDPKTVETFCNNTVHDLKEYVGHFYETPALGLTPDEVGEEVQKLGAAPHIARNISKILETCESYRFADESKNGSTDAVRGIVQEAREVMSMKD